MWIVPGHFTFMIKRIQEVKNRCYKKRKEYWEWGDEEIAQILKKKDEEVEKEKKELERLREELRRQKLFLDRRDQTWGPILAQHQSTTVWS